MPADRQRSRPVPSSTYRIQFSKDQTFDQVRELLPYLDALGAGALYASPLLESGAGSNHGYDVVDPTRISAERGGPEGLRALVAAVREHGLGFVLDIVPNHVGVAGSRENPWWWDVLRHGQGIGVRDVLRHRLGRRADPAPGAGRRRGEGAVGARPLRRRDRAALLRARRARGARHRGRHRAGGARAPALPLRLLEARRGGADLPALLRRVHAGRGARGGPRGVRGHARRDPPLGRRGRGGRPARGPPGRAVGPRRLRAAAAGRHRAGPLAGRREDPGRRGGVARVVAGRRHVGLRGAPGGPGRVRGPGRRGAAHPVRGRAHRQAGVAARGRARRAARGGRHDPRGRGAPHRRARAGRRGRRTGPRGRRRAALRLPRVPLLPPGGPGGARRRRVGRPHPPPRPRRRARRALRRDARRPARRAGHPRAADLRHGDGQGRRGHHVLPVEPVRRAQRGRRGARPLRRLPRRVPRRGRGAGRRQARDHDHALDARHQAVGGRAGPPRRARRDAPGMDRPRAALVGAPPAAGTLAGAAGVAEPRRRVADPGRPDGGLPHEGREGGQARHQPRRGGAGGGRSGRGLARGGARRRRAGRRDRGVRGPDQRARLVELAGPEAAAARGPGGARRLPGHRSLRVLAGRPGQPQAGRLGGAARPARPTRRGLAARRRRGGGGEAPGHHERAAAAPLPAGGVHRVPPAARRWARRRARAWRSSGRRPWSRWRRGCRSGWPPAAGGATRCSRCPTGPPTGTTSSPTPPSTGPHPGSRSSWPATRWRCSSVRRKGGSGRG